MDLQKTLVLKEVAFDAQTYQSTQPVDFPSVGVRVDRVTLEVRAHEIHTMVDFTLTDAAVFDALEDGLWFEFIDPESTEADPYRQRLQAGMSASGSVMPTDETKQHYRQIETLGRNELHETYTLRAYNAWDKNRFETHTIAVEKVE